MSTDFYTDQDTIKGLNPKERKKLLKQDADERGHKRLQKLMDVVTTVVCVAIWLVPLVLALLYTVVLIHKATVGEWQALEDTLKAMLIPVTTYLAGLISKNVLHKTDE